MGVNVYAFVLLIPIAIYLCMIFFIENPLLIDGITAILGLIMLSLSRPIIRRVAQRFMAIKYKRMEDFMA